MTGTAKTGADLAAEADTTLADGQVGTITAARLRQEEEDEAVTIGALQTSESADAAAIASMQSLANTVPHVTYTANHQAVLSDAGKCVEMNSASVINFTIAPDTTVNFITDTVMEVFQLGVGQANIVTGAGVTIHTPTGNFTTRAQYSTVSLRKRADNEWVLSGDIT